MGLGLVALIAGPAAAQGRGGFGRGGGSLAELLGNASVQKELKLDDSQAEKAKELSEKISGEMREKCQELQGLEPGRAARPRCRRSTARSTHRRSRRPASSSSPSRSPASSRSPTRCAGRMAFNDPEVAKKLNLTDAQKTDDPRDRAGRSREDAQPRGLPERPRGRDEEDGGGQQGDALPGRQRSSTTSSRRPGRSCIGAPFEIKYEPRQQLRPAVSIVRPDLVRAGMAAGLRPSARAPHRRSPLSHPHRIDRDRTSIQEPDSMRTVHATLLTWAWWPWSPARRPRRARAAASAPAWAATAGCSPTRASRRSSSSTTSRSRRPRQLDEKMQRGDAREVPGPAGSRAAGAADQDAGDQPRDQHVDAQGGRRVPQARADHPPQADRLPGARGRRPSDDPEVAEEAQHHRRRRSRDIHDHPAGVEAGDEAASSRTTRTTARPR